jgi:hypothetical protein
MTVVDWAKRFVPNGYPNGLDCTKDRANGETHPHENQYVGTMLSSRLPATNPPRQYESALRRLAKNVDVSLGRGERIPFTDGVAPTGARASLGPRTQVLALGVPEEVERSKAEGSNLSLTEGQPSPPLGEGWRSPQSRESWVRGFRGYFPNRRPRRKPECPKCGVCAV